MCRIWDRDARIVHKGDVWYNIVYQIGMEGCACIKYGCSSYAWCLRCPP